MIIDVPPKDIAKVIFNTYIISVQKESTVPSLWGIFKRHNKSTNIFIYAYYK